MCSSDFDAYSNSAKVTHLVGPLESLLVVFHYENCNNSVFDIDAGLLESVDCRTFAGCSKIQVLTCARVMKEFESLQQI